MQTILVADDNAMIREVMEIVLRTNNYNVVLESDGNKVLKTVKRYLPDLILLDVTIGAVSGKDICKGIRSIKKINKIPIIIFSADRRNRYILNKCGDDFLAKGFSIEELLEKINTLLNQKPG